MKRVLSIVLALALACCVSAPLSSCRDSDVLTQKVVDNSGESPIDYTLDPVTTNSPQSDENRSSDVQDETENEDREQQEDTPDYSSDEPTSEKQAEQNAYDNVYTNTDGDASSGGGSADDSANGTTSAATDNAKDDSGSATEQGDGDSQGETSGGDSQRGRTLTIQLPSLSDEPEAQDGTGRSSGNGSADGNESTWNAGQDTNGNGGTDEGNRGSTYADGTYDTIPSASKVAAAGPYATIVQSLGGRGALAAAPQYWLDGLPDSAYDNGNELANVRGVASWGDGTSLTDSAADEIIESGAECVLTSNTFNVMTQDQADKLNNAGIDVLLVPDIGTSTAMDEDIATTVEVVGELLKDAGSYIEFDAKSAAATWKSMHDSAVAWCVSRNGGHTFYSWGTGAQENYYYQGNKRAAQQASNRKNDSSPNAFVCEYVDDWDDENDVGLGNHYLSSTARSSYDLIDYLFQCAGLYRPGYVVSQLSNRDGGRYIVPPNRIPTIKNVPQYNERSWLSTPVIIARDERIAEKIVQQALVDNPAFTDSTSSYWQCSFNLGYDYDVWIMPSDADGSWNDGSFSSYLVAPWAYSMVNGRGTSDADSYVNDFYSTFYRAGAADIVSGYGSEVHVTCPS